MSKRHGAREQKKLAKQKAKRQSRHRQLAKEHSLDPNVRLKAADRWPIVAALVPEGLWSIGLGQLVFARRMPDGQIALAVFLVDVFCLGVKNALWHTVTAGRFDEIVEGIGQREELKKVSPEYFSKLVHCAADYAQSLGFPPHRDFRHARLLLAGIDPSLCKEEFEFGQDGQPFYIRGPGESLEKARAIVARVMELGGNFTIPTAEGFDLSEQFLEDDFEDDEDERDHPDEHVIDV
ncbi:MAG TPA: hypothetical protein VG433_16220 [Pirellulales bacterium]|nr:hypothetical protein [Pirellulales bacterium]